MIVTPRPGRAARPMHRFAILLLLGCEASPPPTTAPPQPAATQWLKGQLHLHSNNSGDSETPPADVARWYAAHGYDFIVFTDHNRVTDEADIGDMLVLPGMEITMIATPPRSAPRSAAVTSMRRTGSCSTRSRARPRDCASSRTMRMRESCASPMGAHVRRPAVRSPAVTVTATYERVSTVAPGPSRGRNLASPRATSTAARATSAPPTARASIDAQHGQRVHACFRGNRWHGICSLHQA
jgi:hypothetical protein